MVSFDKVSYKTIISQGVKYMKKFIIIASILAISLFVTACNREPDYYENGTEPEQNVTAQAPPIQLQPHPAMTAPANIEPVQQTEPPDEPFDDFVPPSGYHFTLSAEERDIYERFLVELDTTIFYGLSPISVAKIYIQAGIDGEWEAEFYAHNQDSMEVTKQEFYEHHLVDLEWFVIESRRSLADWAFPFIDDAEIFIDDDRALLVFYSVPDPDFPAEEQDLLHFMNLLMNEDGIWEMRFRPHTLLLED